MNHKRRYEAGLNKADKWAVLGETNSGIGSYHNTYFGGYDFSEAQVLVIEKLANEAYREGVKAAQYEIRKAIGIIE